MAIQEQNLYQLNTNVWKKIYETTIATLSSATKLLVRGDAIADATGKTVTAVGTAAVSTAQKKFNEVGSSILLDGDSDYLTLADSADFYLDGDFTIDFYARWNSTASDNYILSQKTDNEHYFHISWISGEIRFRVIDVTGICIEVAATWTPTIDVWYHIAITRSGNDFRWFVNGTQVGTTVTDASVLENYTGNLIIGYFDFPSPLYFNGYLSMFRITKGTALWTTTFTPPVYNDYYGPATSLSITGLDGDTDEEYRIIARFVGGVATPSYFLRPNNDSGANYGYQRLTGSNTTVAASRDTSEAQFDFGYNNSAGEVTMQEGILYAKSGYIRTFIKKQQGYTATTTVANIDIKGQSWNNTTDNITSLVILSDQINGLGAGTVIELFKKV